MRALIAALPVAALLFSAAPASADFTTFGSDLSAPASLSDSDPNDWAAWNTGASAAVPVKGELNSVKIKGFVNQTYGGAGEELDSVLVVVLRPNARGELDFAVGSRNVQMPVMGDRNSITTFSRSELNASATDGRMCVEPGDRIAFVTNGGFQQRRPRGLVATVFAPAAEGASRVYKVDNGQGLSSRGAFAGDDRPRELLLQAEIGTGANARPFCGGTEGTPQANPGGGNGGGGNGGGGNPNPNPAPADRTPVLRVAKVSSARVRAKKVSLALTCTDAAPCSGQLLIRRGNKTIAAKRVSVPAGGRATVALRINKTGLRLLNAPRRNKLAVVARVKRDGYDFFDRAFNLVK